jgi:dihydrofolate reductase
MPYWHDDIGVKFFELMQNTDTLLLGRKTWEIHSVFEKMDDQFATAMNDIKKIVVSTSLKDTSAWRNSSIINQNVVEEVKKLKAVDGKNILIDGSSVLLKTLIENKLIDGFYFHIYPLALGTGKKIFSEHDILKLKMVNTKQLPTGVIFAQYDSAYSA